MPKSIEVAKTPETTWLLVQTDDGSLHVRKEVNGKASTTTELSEYLRDALSNIIKDEVQRRVSRMFN